jgi:hypothetical protein
MRGAWILLSKKNEKFSIVYRQSEHADHLASAIISGHQ